jgi:hypothetical protein
MPLLSFEQATIAVIMMTRSFRNWVAQDDGLDDAPSKLIWIGAAVVVALAAVAVAYSVFTKAKTSLPDPTPVPAP